MIDLQKILLDKINKLDLQIASAKFDRDHSATPMESASDKSRQLAEQLMDALLDEKKKIVFLKRNISSNQNITSYSVETPTGERMFTIVHQGLGGSIVDGSTLISQDSPLALRLSHSKIGDLIDLNGQTLKINKIITETKNAVQK